MQWCSPTAVAPPRGQHRHLSAVEEGWVEQALEVVAEAVEADGLELGRRGDGPGGQEAAGGGILNERTAASLGDGVASDRIGGRRPRVAAQCCV
jgi:hypothetical protein